MNHRTRSTLVGSWLVGIFILTASACSSPAIEPEDCGLAHATFLLTVDAQDGHLPADARIRVKYGSGEEVFDARDPEASLKVVFCDLIHAPPVDAGTDAGVDAGQGGALDHISCSLWTDGAATVHITAHGYTDVVRTLEAEKDERCGLVLTEAHVTLEREP